MISSSQRHLPDNTQHSQQTDIHAPVGFDPTISAGERSQTYAFDHASLFPSYFIPMWSNHVFTETLRKYPVIPFLDRMSCSDYELPSPAGNGTITLPDGTGVYIPVLALHHDPTYFPEPQKFDPDRFTEENKHSRPNYVYMPFGEGPRMCIGKDRHLLAPCMSFRFQSP
jgi:cytochrome P450